MPSFSESLRALRIQSGYPSSRGFFNGLGGRRFFGCTYRQYLNVERGSRTPSAVLMEKISVGLQLAMSHDRESAQNLLLAYLRSLVGDGALLKLIIQTMRPSGAPALTRSLGRRSNEGVVPLTREQSDFIRSNFENYWTFSLLASDCATWSAEDLAGILGGAPRAVEKALGVGPFELATKTAPLSELHPDQTHRHPSTQCFRTETSC